MKIAFLTPEFPHPKIGASGGIGTSIANLAAGFVDAGHEVSILVYGQPEDEVFTESGLAFYRIKNIKIKGLSWYFTRKKVEKLLNKLHREGKVDIAEAPDWVGISSFINANCPLVVRLHGSDTYFCHLDKRPVSRASRFHEGRALRRADALLSVSRYTAKVTAELFSLTREFTVIPNGVDTARFEASLPPGNFDILYFGTLIRKKGLLELPAIFNKVIDRIPKARLRLIGRDAPDVVTGSRSTWEMMRKLFSDQALQNVEYVGSVPYDEIKNQIKHAAVCVFPTFAEALPVSWIEAMAMKKPSVASSIGWAEEIIEDGTSGFLEHPQNHQSFAKKICVLLEDLELQRSVGENARGRVMSHFDRDVVTAQNIKFYTSLIKK